MITLMGLRSIMPRLVCLVLLGTPGLPEHCLGQTAQVKVHRTVLSEAEHLRTSKLVSDKGYPVTVDYYNVKGELKAIAARFEKECPLEEGWKKKSAAGMAVFTNTKLRADVRWQRIAAFKGRLNRSLRVVPRSESAWVNIILYRVKAN